MRREKLLLINLIVNGYNLLTCLTYAEGGPTEILQHFNDRGRIIWGYSAIIIFLLSQNVNNHAAQRVIELHLQGGC